MILIVDNYDSFSYNLYQMLGTIEPAVEVVRNDALDAEGIAALGPEAVVLSPGPGRPEDAGVCMEAVRKLGGRIPMLGVCLGHQAICAAHGATVSYAKTLMHGKASDLRKEETCALFEGLPPVFRAARYHSLAALEETLPECLAVTARADDGEVMAVMHRGQPTFGVQFHPESILTPEGGRILANFVEISRRFGRGA